MKLSELIKTHGITTVTVNHDWKSFDEHKRKTLYHGSVQGVPAELLTLDAFIWSIDGGELSASVKNRPARQFLARP